MFRNKVAFRERFKRWKLGELVYNQGRPIEPSNYDLGKDDEPVNPDNPVPLRGVTVEARPTREILYRDGTPVSVFYPQRYVWKDYNGDLQTFNNQGKTTPFRGDFDPNYNVLLNDQDFYKARMGQYHAADTNHNRALANATRNLATALTLGAATEAVGSTALFSRAGRSLLNAGDRGVSAIMRSSAYPYLKAGVASTFAAEGLNRLTSDEGLAKTGRLFDQGDYWGATKSAAGDLLDVSMLAPMIKPVGNMLRGAGSWLNKGANYINNLIPSYQLYREIGKTTPSLYPASRTPVYFDNGVRTFDTNNPLPLIDFSGTLARPTISWEIATNPMDKFAVVKPVPQYVKDSFANQIIPRRLQLFKLTQPTKGASKIEDYIKENGEVDFYTRDGQEVATQQGWTFDEIEDYMNYKNFESSLSDVTSKDYIEYPTDVWNYYKSVDENRDGILGTYSPSKDVVEVPEDFFNPTLVHEYRHRMQKMAPSSQSERNILRNAYSYDLPTDELDKTIRNKELETVNSTFRDILLDKYNARNMLVKTQNLLLDNERYYSDSDILYKLWDMDAYGERIVENINKRLDGIKKSLENLGIKPGAAEFDSYVEQNMREIVRDIRYALTHVGGYAIPIGLGLGLYGTTRQNYKNGKDDNDPIYPNLIEDDPFRLGFYRYSKRRRIAPRK